MKLDKFIKENYVECLLFFIFFTYFSFWLKFNFKTVIINNNELELAINLYKYNPYISYLFNKLSELIKLKIFFGYVLFPSFVVVVLYKIFHKLSGSKLWAISLSLLSIISTENYPFIKFLISFFNLEGTQLSYNLYENFEIQGFPLPSLSVLYFSCLFYIFFKTIKMSIKDLYIISFLWIIGPLIHPFDGIIGLIFWNFIILIFWKLKKIKINNLFFVYFIIINFIVIFLVSNQIDLTNQIIFKKQEYSFYKILVYFIIPLLLVILCIKYFKVDLHEFYQKFLGIYIMFFIELLIIFSSALGYGFDLRMTENRIFMFLIHFLYYVPIIYYLNKDSFFLISKNENYNFSEKKFLYIIFCKFNKVYLPAFSLLMFFYLFKSINL